MKIEQKPILFNPVTILLETEEELNALLEILDEYTEDDRNAHSLKTKISNWYSNVYNTVSEVCALIKEKPIANKEVEKYLIFKSEDINNLRGNKEFRCALETIIRYYHGYRDKHGKSIRNKYIVCNQDEPYAENVWRIILEGEYKKTHENNRKL